MKVPRDNPTVCVLGSTFVTGGAERVAQALVRGLGRFGLQPMVVALHCAGPVGEELSELGVSFFSDLARSSRDPRIAAKLARIFRQGSVDLLYCLDHHDALFWGGISSKLARVERLVLGVHSTGLWGRPSSFTFSDRLVMRLCDRVVALARPHADYIERHGSVPRQRIEIIHNGVDVERFEPLDSSLNRERLREGLGLPRDAFVVVMIAALRPEKNHEMLIRSIGAIPSPERPHVLIVGEGSEEQRLRALVDESGSGDSIRFLGRRDDVPGVLAASDLFVLCSHPVVETFPLSLLEAMASGLPVVVTRVGSIDEILTDGVHGYVIEPGDQEALIRSIVSVMRDGPGRSEMGKRGRERIVEHFSEDRMVERYAELFHGLLGTGVDAKGNAARRSAV